MAWSQQYDPELGGVYWFNDATGQQTTTPPPEVLAAQTVGRTPELGNPIYFNGPGPTPTPGMAYDFTGNTDAGTTGVYRAPSAPVTPGAFATSTVPQIQERDTKDPLLAGLAATAPLWFAGGPLAGYGLGASGGGAGGALSGSVDSGVLAGGAAGDTVGLTGSALNDAFQAELGGGLGNATAGTFTPGIGFTAGAAGAAGYTPAAGGAGVDAGSYGVPASGAPNAAATAAASTAADAAKQTALSKILNGTATADDYAKLAGQALPGLISAYGNTQQADVLKGIEDKAQAARQPYLDKSMKWLNNPQSFYDTVGKSSLDATLRGLSVGGNPIGDPTKLAIASDVGAKNLLSAVTGFGNLGLAGEDTRAQLQTNAANTGNIYPNLGAAATSVLNPPDDLTTLLSKLKGYGVNATGLS